MSSSNNSSGTNQCVAVPLRIFLCDVIKFAKQNNTNRLFRLMGTIVEILPQPADGRPLSSCQKDPTEQVLISFIIDDGSGTVAVFTERRMRLDSCSLTEVVSNQQSVPQHQRQHGREIDQYDNDFSSSSIDTSRSILSSPLPALKVGQTVDCIGNFVVDSGDGSSDDQKLKDIDEEGQSTNRMIWFAASAVSIVASPQEASIRQIELCSSSNEKNIRSHSNLTTDSCRTTKGKPVDDDMPRNRILMTGDLNLKVNSLLYNNNHHHQQQQQEQPMFKPDDAFRYIRYSKDDGGISGSDLALLVGATKTKEKLAVKAAVEHLQNLGMVYMKQGKYYPL
ncbi:hypothetical protein ACHAWT_007863 [Skeletonema menzelii]